jgi:hypothetical protein
LPLNKLNVDAIVGLAATTAMLRCDYDQYAKPSLVEDQDAWGSVIELTVDYLNWVGVDSTCIQIDKYVIAKSFWGMDESDLDEALAEYSSDEEEYSY